jgi:PAS domain-containing protein
VRAYVEFRGLKAASDGELVLAMRALVQFWTVLLQPDPCVNRLAATGKTARVHLAQAIEHLERMLVLHPGSAPTMRLYGQVAAQVLGDTVRAEELLELADEVERTKRSQMLESDFSGFLETLAGVNLDVFAAENGVISVSVAEHSIGEVLEVNPAVVKMLGLSSAASIVGRNCNVIIPEPIRSHHDRYLRRFISSRSGRLLNRTTLLFAVGANHFLAPVQVQIRWADEALAKMIVVVQAMPVKQEVALMVDAETKQVTYATQNLASLFGFSKRDILAKKLTLADVVPSLREDDNSNAHEVAWMQMRSAKGHQCDAAHITTQQGLRLHAFATLVPVFEDSFYFVNCQVSQVADDDDAAENDDPEFADSVAPEELVQAELPRPHSSVGSSGSRSRADKERGSLSRSRSRHSGASRRSSQSMAVSIDEGTPAKVLRSSKNQFPPLPPSFAFPAGRPQRTRPSSTTPG